MNELKLGKDVVVKQEGLPGKPGDTPKQKGREGKGGRGGGEREGGRKANSLDSLVTPPFWFLGHNDMISCVWRDSQLNRPPKPLGSIAGRRRWQRPRSPLANQPCHWKLREGLPPPSPRFPSRIEL